MRPIKCIRTVRGGTALALAALMLALPACGGSDGGDGSEPSAPRYTAHSNDRGAAVEKQRLFELWTRISKAFRDGDAEAVCESFGRSINSLSDYQALDADARLAECRRDVAHAIDAADGGDVDPPPRKVRWIRVYIDIGMVAGVTTTGGGSSMRLQFAKRGDRWYSAFSVPEGLEGL